MNLTTGTGRRGRRGRRDGPIRRAATSREEPTDGWGRRGKKRKNRSKIAFATSLAAADDAIASSIPSTEDSSDWCDGGDVRRFARRCVDWLGQSSVRPSVRPSLRWSVPPPVIQTAKHPVASSAFRICTDVVDGDCDRYEKPNRLAS